MKLDKEGLLAKDPAALRELERVVRHSVRIGAGQVGAIEFVDDIVQELMLLILYRTIHVYDPAREIEPFLIKASKLAGMAMRRKHSREVLVGHDDDDGLGGRWLENVPDPNGEAADEKIDKDRHDLRAAAESFIATAALAMQEVADPPVQATDSPVRDAPRAALRKPRRFTGAWDKLALIESDSGRKTARRRVDPAALRIRDIRREIGYTHKWMASALGVPISHMHAIEYGAKAPSPVMAQRAEALLESLRREAPALVARPVGDVVLGWFRRLGLRDDDYAGFAQEIGVDRSTAFRWLRKSYKPTPERLWAVEMMVQDAEKRRAALVAAIPRVV